MTIYLCSRSFGKVSIDAPMTTRKTAYSLLLSALLPGICLLLPACGEPPPPPGAEQAQISGQPAPPTADPAAIATRVVADFLSIPASEITLVSVESKEFADPSLGCPAPGMSYAQVITPGHRVIVEAEGRRFDVRVSGSSGKICRKPVDKIVPDRSGEPPPGPTSPVTSKVERARADLAARLDVAANDIAVLDVRPYIPGTVVSGCRPECGNASDGCGIVIGLYYDGRRYDYHAHRDGAVPCPELSPS